MKISTRGRYATRIMVRLAICSQDRPASKSELAAAEALSPHYAEQILLKLASAGLVRSRRGSGGGFSLAQAADAITVADVLDATEGSLAIAPCLKGACVRKEICSTRALWLQANDALQKLFQETTIAELANRATDAQNAGLETFQI